VNCLGWAAVFVAEGVAVLYGVLIYQRFPPPRYDAKVSPPT
jgi:hypothetical protein